MRRSRRPFGETRAEYEKRIKASQYKGCQARREGDEMVCHRCAIRWPYDEDKPPAAKCD